MEAADRIERAYQVTNELANPHTSSCLHCRVPDPAKRAVHSVPSMSFHGHMVSTTCVNSASWEISHQRNDADGETNGIRTLT